jgi:ribosome-associated protein
VLVIKDQSARTQEQNRALAMHRLQRIVDDASRVQAARRPTKPTYGSKQRRLQNKAMRAEVKAGRRKQDE